MHIPVTRYEIVRVEEDFAVARVKFLNPADGKEMFEVSCNVVKRDCIRNLLKKSGFKILKLSPIEYSEEIEKYGFIPQQFRAHTDEIGIIYCFLAESV